MNLNHITFREDVKVLMKYIVQLNNIDTYPSIVALFFIVNQKNDFTYIPTYLWVKEQLLLRNKYVFNAEKRGFIKNGFFVSFKEFVNLTLEELKRIVYKNELKNEFK